MEFVAMGLVGIACAVIGGAIGFVIGKRDGGRRSKLPRMKIYSQATGWYDSEDGWHTVETPPTTLPADPNESRAVTR